MTDNPTIDHLPEETQTYIRQLRSEAAKYRTERNDFQTKYNEVNTKYTEAGNLLQQANTQLDKFATLESTAEENAKRLAELEQVRQRESIAWEAGLTPEDAGRLQGANADEWKADAEKLAARLNPSGRRRLTPDPAAAGAQDTVIPGNEDPIRKAFLDAGVL
jgi:chromosome segregation ATPase